MSSLKKEVDLAEYERLVGLELPQREMAAHFGMSITTFRNRLKAHGKARFLAEGRGKLRAMAARGLLPDGGVDGGA